MRFAHIFVDRPIFAAVISIIITLSGAIAYTQLPVAQYPEVAPPTIQVTASYPGASAEVVAETVAAPLEQEINGVENSIYMLSQATADGDLTITVTFELGTDLDTAQVLVQNRVTIAEPRLPEEVRARGVNVRKNSPDLMMVIHLNSPDGSLDQLYISNYGTLQVRDVISRVKGVGDARLFGAREYSMRLWLDPERLAELNLTAGDVVAAVEGQNVQVASGALNRAPVPQPGAFELNIQTQGRLEDAREFENIVVKTDDRRPGHPHPRHRPRRAGGGGIPQQLLPRRPAGGGAGDLPAPGLERARDRDQRHRRDGAAGRRTSRPACNTTSSTTRPSSSRNWSTR